jgi:hypothetical protein
MVHIYYEDKKITSLLELEVSALRIIRYDGELWQIDPEDVQIEAIVPASKEFL